LTIQDYTGNAFYIMRLIIFQFERGKDQQKDAKTAYKTL